MSTFKYYKNGQWHYVNGTITGDTLPIGSIIPFGGETAPSGWLLCWGQELSRASYPELYSVIGDAFGGDDGDLTFNLPDLRGRTIVGKNFADTDFNTIGKTGGEKTHTLIQAEAPVNTVFSDGGESSGTWAPGKWATYDGYVLKSGGGQAHNILQPYQVTNYIIKYKNAVGLVGNVLDSSSNSHTDSYSCDYINNAVLDKYSTTEQIIGTWIDGSTIYRKIIYISELPNNASAAYATNISDINVVTKLSGIAFGSNGNSFPLPYVGRFSGDISADIELTFLSGDSTIRIITGNDRSSLSAYICLEYTKD